MLTPNFINTAAPTIVKPVKPPKKAPALLSGWKTAVILPDPQFGFRNIDGVLDPFHDVNALNVATQVLAAVAQDSRVDVVVNLGDFLDLPAQSKYEQRAEWQNTTQEALNAGHYWLAEQRATVPNAQIVVLEGNHDKRLQDSVLRFNMASAGLRVATVANKVPSAYAVLTVPYLLDVESLGIEWLDGYPARKFWINDTIKCVHGSIIRSSASTASAYSRLEPSSTIFGHVHRIEIHHTTRQDRYGPVRTFGATPGCLCRVDGAVPSRKGAQSITGEPIKSYEDWQQGCMVLHYKEDDPRYVLDPIHIQDGWAMYMGQEFNA